MADVGKELRQALAESLAPTRELLERVEHEITEHEAALTELRATRTQARRVIALLNPEEKPKRAPRGEGSKDVSRTSLDALRDWLEAHRHELDGSPIYPKLVDEHPDHPDISRQTITVALKVLVDEGMLRLDSVSQGGRKNYVFVDGS